MDIPTFTIAQVKSLTAWTPKAGHSHQRRLKLLVLILLDTGCRITEALTLRGSAHNQSKQGGFWNAFKTSLGSGLGSVLSGGAQKGFV